MNKDIEFPRPEIMTINRRKPLQFFAQFLFERDEPVEIVEPGSGKLDD